MTSEQILAMILDLYTGLQTARGELAAKTAQLDQANARIAELETRAETP